ncbi:MAG: 50S ribosomal protein L5 [Candidatus Paceibacterota bacterium]
MQSIKEKYEKIVIPEMKKKFGYKNSLAVPKIIKVAVATGIGSMKDEEKKKIIESSLSTITGQKSVPNVAKKSIATFKTREGMVIGHSVTLRGNRMYDFLEKLVNVTIPRVRDFRGIDPKVIDAQGNLTVGFKEHTVFPETASDDVRKAFGLGVTIATTAKNKEEALEMLKLLGMPFKKK